MLQHILFKILPTQFILLLCASFVTVSPDIYFKTLWSGEASIESLESNEAWSIPQFAGEKGDVGSAKDYQQYYKEDELFPQMELISFSYYPRPPQIFQALPSTPTAFEEEEILTPAVEFQSERGMKKKKGMKKNKMKKKKMKKKKMKKKKKKEKKKKGCKVMGKWKDKWFSFNCMWHLTGAMDMDNENEGWGR